MAIGVILIATWPWWMGKKPSDSASTDAKLAYLERGAVFVVVVVVFLAFAMIGSIFIVRFARAEYREQVEENLRELIVGAQTDAQKSAQSPGRTQAKESDNPVEHREE